MEIEKLKTKTVLLSTYINTASDETYALFGPIENITGYLSRVFKGLYMIKQPMSGEKDLTPVLSFYVDNREVWTKAMPGLWKILSLTFRNDFSSERTSVRLKIRDFISNLYFTLFCVKNKIDLFIGVESINSIASIVLKKINRIKTVLYFANDYHPKRYSPLMNKIFLGLDTFMACKADYLWVMNPRINESRFQRGIEKNRIAPCYIIHGGLPFFDGKPLPINKRKKYQIIYATRAGHEGLNIVIKAFVAVLKSYPDAKLIITGHADREKHIYDEYLIKYKIKNSVQFTGFIKEKELNLLVMESYIGIAVWPCNIAVSATYGDPEKIRRYFHYGLPVVTTSNAFTAEKVEQGAGIIAEDNETSVAYAIRKIFEDDVLYSEFAKTSHEIGVAYSRRNVLDDSFEDMVAKKLI